MLRADVPEEPEVSAHLHAELSRLGVPVPGPAQEEVEPRPQVRIFEDASLDRSDLIGAFDPASDVGGHFGEVGGMPVPDEFGFFGGLQLFERILPDRLQHLEPVSGTRDLDQPHVDERSQIVEHGTGIVGTGGFDALERASPLEDAHPAEQPFLRRRSAASGSSRSSPGAFAAGPGDLVDPR